MLHRRVVVGSIGLLAGIALAAVFLPPRRIAPERHLAGEARLPAAARIALHERMQRHGITMENLVWQVLLLDYDGAAQSVGELQAEPTLARPLSGEASELNAQLPERFFQLQDELRAREAAVSAAASARDPQKLADAFAGCTRTCVGCHEAYLAPR